MLDRSPTLRDLVDRADRAGLRIHVMPEQPLPDEASAVLTIVEGNPGVSDVVVRLDATAADARLAETLEHEIGHALTGAGRPAAGAGEALSEALGQLGLLSAGQ